MSGASGVSPASGPSGVSADSVPTSISSGAAAGNANHAEAEAASKDGVLTLPQTGDEKGLVFAVILLVSGVAAVGAALPATNPTAVTPTRGASLHGSLTQAHPSNSA